MTESGKLCHLNCLLTNDTLGLCSLTYTTNLGSIIAICIVNETFYGVSKARPRFSLKLKEGGLTPQVSPLGPPTL